MTKEPVPEDDKDNTLNLEDKEIIKNTYTIDREYTNKDGFCVYYAVSSTEFSPVILKELDEKRALIYQNLMQYRNKYVADIYGVMKLKNTTVNDKPVYLAVTECVINNDINNDNATLTNYVKERGPLDEKTALMLCMKICRGLKEIHKAGIIHKDLKPDNIMVSNEIDDDGLPVIKIIDFGISEKDEERLTTVIKTSKEDAGTEGYNPHDKKVTAKWDVYSIGCILNFMLTKHTPDMDIYKESWKVRQIIENATDDYSARYTSVALLDKKMRNVARIGIINRIPIIRSIPGFRTQTPWKTLVAIIVYSLIFFILGSLVIIEKPISLITICLIFWLVVPMFFIFEPFNWLSRVKGIKKIKRNTYFISLIKAVVVALSYFSGILLIILFGQR